jgi:hypothetical protein
MFFPRRGEWQAEVPLPVRSARRETEKTSIIEPWL